jgi:hypothetical protein
MNHPMGSAVSPKEPASVTRAQNGRTPLDRLRHVIEPAAHLLPAQGPITVFIHHNTLHALNLTFEQAVRRGGEVLGCQPDASEELKQDTPVGKTVDSMTGN